MNLRLKTLEIARGEYQAGVREQGGNNRGPRVSQYQKAAGIGSEAWCAAFVNWCAEQAAASMRVKSPLERVPLQGYCQSYYEHFKKLGFLVKPEEAMPGDLFLLWYQNLNRGKGRYGHIGFVFRNQPDENGFYSIEGNTTLKGTRDSSAGDGVNSLFRRYTAKPTVFVRWTRVVEALAS